MPLEEREAGESWIRTNCINREPSTACENRTIIPAANDHTTVSIKRLLTYTSNKQNQFAPTIHAITSFHHRFQ